MRRLLLALAITTGMQASLVPSAHASAPRSNPRTVVPRPLSPTPSNRPARGGFFTPDARVTSHRRTAELHLDRLDRFATQRYGASGARALARLRALGPSYAQLVTDPGIVTYLRDFERFVAGADAKGVSPWEVRQAFSKQLGDTVVFRSMALTADEHREVLARGIESNVVRRGDWKDGETAGNWEVRRRTATTHNLTELAHSRIAADGGSIDPLADPLISVSELPVVAVAAGAKFTEIRRGPKRDLYLFELRVPKLDVVFRKAGGAMPPFVDSQELSAWGFTKPGRWQEVRRPFRSKAVESFVLYRVEPSEIVSTRIVPEPDAAGYHTAQVWTLWSKNALRENRREIHSLLQSLKNDMDKGTPADDPNVAARVARLDELEAAVKLRAPPPGLRGQPSLERSETEAISRMWEAGTTLAGFDDGLQRALRAYRRKVREVQHLPGTGKWYDLRTETWYVDD